MPRVHLFSLSLHPAWPLSLSPLTTLPSLKCPFFSLSLPLPVACPPLCCPSPGTKKPLHRSGMREGDVCCFCTGAWQAEGRHGGSCEPVPRQHPPAFGCPPWGEGGGMKGKFGEGKGKRGEGRERKRREEAPVQTVGGQRGSPVWS